MFMRCSKTQQYPITMLNYKKSINVVEFVVAAVAADDDDDDDDDDR